MIWVLIGNGGFIDPALSSTDIEAGRQATNGHARTFDLPSYSGLAAARHFFRKDNPVTGTYYGVSVAGNSSWYPKHVLNGAAPRDLPCL